MPDLAGRAQDVLNRSVWAEVGYRSPDGRVDAVPLVPLTADGTPLFALTYADRDVAEGIAGSGAVAVAVSDPRLGFGGWRPAVLSARLRLDEDRDGTRFREDLLDEELRKHPPSRLLADSLVQRREHWWFLPRLLLRLEHVSSVAELAPRRSGDDGVLFWDSGGGVGATTVSVEDWSAPEVVVTPLGGQPPVGALDVCLLRHDFSPDLERRALLRVQGRLDRDRLEVGRREGTVEIPPPAGVLARWRGVRSLERACRAGLSGAV